MVGRGWAAPDLLPVPPRWENMLPYVIPVLAAGLFAIAAYGDVRTRRIPNALALAVASLGVVRLTLAGDFGAALHRRGYIGGGDVKLMAAAVLLVGHQALSEFLLALAVCGLVVTLAVLSAGRLAVRPAPQSGAYNPTPARPTVPYAVPIAAAGILTLVLQSPVSW